MKLKNAALIGLGGIGCTVYPGLLQALGEENVFAIADGARRQRLESRGVTINGRHYAVHALTPERLPGGVDLLIFAVKFHQLEQAIRDAAPYVGEHTVLLSLMNGITSEEDIGDAFGRQHLIYCITEKNCIYRDGNASFALNDKGLSLGVRDSAVLPDLEALEELLRRSDIPFARSEDIIHKMWYKFLINVSGNSVSAVLKMDCGDFQRLESITRARFCIIREIVALSQAMGTGLTEEDAESLRDYYHGFPASAMCSTLQDVLAGRQTENEMLCGTVVRLGREQGVPTPATELLYYLLQAIDDKNRA